MSEDITLALSFVALIAGGAWALNLLQVNVRHRVAHGSFGKPNRLRTDEQSLLMRQYLKQQNQSFGLVWFSISLGLVLAGLFIGRAVFADRIDSRLIASAAGIAGDIWLGRYAWKLYTVASQKVERLLEASEATRSPSAL